MATLVDQASGLLDFQKPLDIKLLDSVVLCMLSGSGDEVKQQKVFSKIIWQCTTSCETWTWLFLWLMVYVLVTVKSICSHFKLRFCHLFLSSIIRALRLSFALPKTFIKSYNDYHVTTMVILTGIIVFPLPQQQLAHQILTTLKEDHRAWTRVDSILELSSQEESKYYGLQILEDLIKTRWKTLPREHCESIKK